MSNKKIIIIGAIIRSFLNATWPLTAYAAESAPPQERVAMTGFWTFCDTHKD